jgi:hypothetical protein
MTKYRYQNKKGPAKDLDYGFHRVSAPYRGVQASRAGLQ